MQWGLLSLMIIKHKKGINMEGQIERDRHTHKEIEKEKERD